MYERTGPNCDGQCEPPIRKGKRLKVRPGLKKDPRRLLTILIHEVLHAESWPLSEDFVTNAAEDIARLLWSQGYRLAGKDS